LEEGTAVPVHRHSEYGYKIEKWVVKRNRDDERGRQRGVRYFRYVTANSLDRNLTIEVYFTLGMCEVSYAPANMAHLAPK
jgi:hypothetical protein